MPLSIPTYATGSVPWQLVLIDAWIGGIWLRSWFMGVWLLPEEVRIAAWVWVYRRPYIQIASVADESYTGVLGVGVSYIPFVGAVREVAFTLTSGNSGMYPSTIGRMRSVQQVCRLIRQRLPDARSMIVTRVEAG